MNRLLSLMAAICLLWLCAAPTFPAATSSSGQVGQFQDVSPTSAFAAAIDWAVQNGITEGTSKTTFSPNDPCSVRAILKFLWAYKGSPHDSDNVYADVKDPFRQAANWAYHRGYEMGHTVGERLELDGAQGCTRLRVVTYLWLMAGRPMEYQDSSGNVKEYKDSSKDFEDIDRSGNGAFPQQEWAVGWAAAKEITKGVSATAFSPESICTRGQIATFLYRYDQAVNG